MRKSFEIKTIEKIKNRNQIQIKNENMEKKIYEFLGIKKFRDLAFLLNRKTCYSKLTDREYNKTASRTSNNYFMGRINNIEDVAKFKKQLKINTILHTIGLLACSGVLLLSLSTIATIIAAPLLIVNIYCVMLQRYNDIRINNIINKRGKEYDKSKDNLKEYINNSEYINEHQIIKIIDEKGKKIPVEYEEFMSKASLDQLKTLCMLLKMSQKYNSSSTPEITNKDSYTKTRNYRKAGRKMERYRRQNPEPRVY